MKLSIEAKRAQLRARLEDIAAHDPWGDAACVRAEKLDCVLNCLTSVLPDNPTFSDITVELDAIKARGDGSVFHTLGEAHEHLTRRQNGTNNVAPPLTSDVKAKLKNISAAEKLEIANELAFQQMKGARK